jgi:hypothetical protein
MHGRFLIITALALAGCHQGPPPDPALARANAALFERAQGEIDAKQWERADRDLEGLLSQDPNHAGARELLRLARAGVSIARASRVEPGAIEPDHDWWIAHDLIDTGPVTAVLESRRVTLRFDAKPLGDAVRWLEDASGVRARLDSRADPTRPITLHLDRSSLSAAFDGVASAGGLDLRVEATSVAMIARPEPVPPADACLDFYDVSDIVDELPAFPAPEIHLPPPGTEQPKSGLTGGVLTFDEPPRKRTGVDPYKLVALIENKLGGCWVGAVEYCNGVLIARTTRDGHERIEQLLAALRALSLRRPATRAYIQGVEVNSSGAPIPVLNPVVGILNADSEPVADSPGR